MNLPHDILSLRDEEMKMMKGKFTREEMNRDSSKRQKC